MLIPSLFLLSEWVQASRVLSTGLLRSLASFLAWVLVGLESLLPLVPALESPLVSALESLLSFPALLRLVPSLESPLVSSLESPLFSALELLRPS